MPRIKFILASVVAVVVDILQKVDFNSISNVQCVFLEHTVLKEEQHRPILAFNVVLVNFRLQLEQYRLSLVFLVVRVLGLPNLDLAHRHNVSHVMLEHTVAQMEQYHPNIAFHVVLVHTTPDPRQLMQQHVLNVVKENGVLI